MIDHFIYAKGTERYIDERDCGSTAAVYALQRIDIEAQLEEGIQV